MLNKLLIYILSIVDDIFSIVNLPKKAKNYLLTIELQKSCKEYIVEELKNKVFLKSFRVKETVADIINSVDKAKTLE